MSGRDRPPAAASVAGVSAVVIAAVALWVAVGYPDWMWWPLTVAFWTAGLVLLVSIGMLLRRRLVHT